MASTFLKLREREPEGWKVNREEAENNAQVCGGSLMRNGLCVFSLPCLYLFLGKLPSTVK